jgi:ABC-type polysaccharide/polyol phosphate transport system ATPase subunit
MTKNNGRKGAKPTSAKPKLPSSGSTNATDATNATNAANQSAARGSAVNPQANDVLRAGLNTDPEVGVSRGRNVDLLDGDGGESSIDGEEVLAIIDGRARNVANKQRGRRIALNAKPSIEVDHLSKLFRLYEERNASLKATLMRGRRSKFKEFWALDDVSFDILPGETFGIIGENGSGKSTMLKCMARILRPDKGRVEVHGKLSALLELGAGFHPELSGRENVYLNGSILGLSRRQLDEKFDEIVDFAGLEEFIDQPVKNYSSGMYVRLGFSIAINVNPDVLLVDEVLAVGDEAFQRRCGEKFADLQEMGKTIVIVSHAMGSVRSMCDRLAWLDHGELRMVGQTRDVIDAYLGNVHVAELHHKEGEGTRWGNGAATIDAIELVSNRGRGEVVAKAKTGDAVAVRIHYTVNGKALRRPVIGFAMHRIDGVHVAGVNIREYDMVPELLEGTGYYDYVIDKLPLLAGTYEVTAAMQDEQYHTTYDWWSNGLRFEVAPAIVHESEGIVTFLGHWEHPESKRSSRRI